MYISKHDFYGQRSRTYLKENPEEYIRYKRAFEWIENRDDLCFMEIGCKFGFVRQLLAKRLTSFFYKGIDISQETLEQIDGYNETEYICHDANTGMPFQDASVNYLLCLEILEHLENATFFLEEVQRVLTPHGKLILSVPNPYCWTEYYANWRHGKDTEGHIATYTRQNIDALLRFSGLKLMDMRGTYSRIPYSHRIFGKPIYFKTDRMLLTRSYLFLIGK